MSQLRVEIEDPTGAIVFGPTDVPNDPEITLDIPSDSATLDLAYLNADGDPVASFVTQIDPTNRPVVRIDNPAQVDDTDPVTYRFAFYGCNRLGFSELSADNPSSANRAQLLKDFQELPERQIGRVFINGDLVTNEDEGTDTLVGQLTGWLEIVADTPLLQSAIPVVAFTGNHEILASREIGNTGEYVEFPNPGTLPVWENLMQAFIGGADGPTTAAPNLDQLTHDQSRFSYTLREGGILFVVVNTDTFIDAKTIGDVPLNWIEEELAAGQADPTVEHIFVLGHKPIVAPGPDESPIRPEEAPRMEQLLASTPKVRGYLCAHSHLWEQRDLPSGLTQVVAGNGGSPVEAPFNNTNRGFFGYTLVAVHASGQVHVEAFGRPIPNPYDSLAPQPESTLKVKQQL